jgi:integrase
MASLSTDGSGRRLVYVVLSGKRVKISLGAVTKKDAISILAKIEHLVSKKLSKLAPDNEVANWIGSMDRDDRLFRRLVSLGLIEPRAVVEPAVQQEVHTIKSVVDKFVALKRPMLASRSIDKMEECLGVLLECLGGDRDILFLTDGDAIEFESWGMAKGFSEAHQRTHNRYAKQLFSHAVDKKLIDENPFRKLKSTSLAATTRHYVTPEDTHSLLEACPGIQWKLLVGLARYAGLRVPSEAFAITWSMVDWDKKALSIPSKKTRRYAESRVMPVLPELMDLLQVGWDEAPEGSTNILTLSYANIRRKLPKIILDAKLKPWEDMFQTLRRSCETHFVSLGHPAHAVSDWLGHSSQVSKDHYLMVTSDTFTRATEVKTEVKGRPTTARPKMGAEMDAVGSGNNRKRPEMGAEVGALPSEVVESLNEKTQVNPGNSLVVRAGIEPATHGFSVRCSTY